MCHWEEDYRGETRIRAFSLNRNYLFNFLQKMWVPCGLVLPLSISYHSLLQGTTPAEKAQNAPYKISIPVDLVVLPVTVLDRKGHFASDLNIEDFRVSENGQPQEIKSVLHEDVPVTAGLVLDNSGTMRPEFSKVNAAAIAFAESSNPQDEMFVVKFNENVILGLPDGVPFTSDKEVLRTALVRNPPRGKTALYDATIAALEHIQLGSRGKKVLLIVSDGGDNSSQSSFPQVLELAKRSNAVIYAIGLYDVLEKERNLAVLGRLASITGVEVFLPETVDRVLSICQRKGPNLEIPSKKQDPSCFASGVEPPIDVSPGLCLVRLDIS
jgi:hypothetical protein